MRVDILPASAAAAAAAAQVHSQRPERVYELVEVHGQSVEFHGQSVELLLILARRTFASSSPEFVGFCTRIVELHVFHRSRFHDD
jgi:hypothetical protein